MKQEPDLDAVIRQRIRGLRLSKGWSLDTLAERCFLSPSTLSRIETGHRRIALDQLVPIARALDTSIDQLVESAEGDDDVVIRPEPQHAAGRTTWLLTREPTANGTTVAKMRLTPQPDDATRGLGVHPGHEWFTVLSGTARLRLGERTILVETGDAASFSTMVPHAISAHGGPLEILTIFDRDGERAHLHAGKAATAPGEHEA
ncbi:Cupin domain-containing protein [Paramicrobacterium humi]|uniref:Cupin domain-containing protein n=1 Tax=Paramicrobacterium humi TaxID=640635 RepID=A0A1H4KNM8_9MICO|nr:XRE family transcriptional regulator [Microbacterium humi]SEB60110.1 Cupin domain-containing protein [Microbacterium humi]